MVMANPVTLYKRDLSSEVRVAIQKLLASIEQIQHIAIQKLLGLNCTGSTKLCYICNLYIYITKYDVFCYLFSPSVSLL